MTMAGMASSGTDLFGPDPGANPLAYYNSIVPAADLFASAKPDVAKAWHTFASGLAAQGQGNLAGLQDYLDRHVEDLGLAFRLTGDEHERPWPMGPMPLIIGAKEWADIECGLIQRAQLLEAVISDIYGQQSLVACGHLPAALVSGSANFARRMVGVRPSGGRFLRVCAIDLARGPTGEWRVLADRVRLPVGIGYAQENRMALGRMTGGLLSSIGTRRQGDFFDALRLGIASACARVDPRIGLLTPGRFNQSYPEQAHLARHLGFSLVEGRDLVVRENKLYVRTIAGLKRIDALWRWIGARDIDPLNFDARSQIGVPNLVSAAMSGELVLANWPGTGVVESRAMAAFLPRLAGQVLGEPLKLPNAATWWCGQENERAYVLDHFDNLVISSAFRQNVRGLEGGRTRAGASLSDSARKAVLEGIARRPMDYTAQEIVSLSTTPALVDGRFEPRSFTLRVFLTRDCDDNWVVMPGGLARTSQHGDLRTSLMGLGDISTDVCIVDQAQPADAVAVPADPLKTPVIRREHGLLPSQAADNLFWIGRYGERAHQTCRVIRLLLDSATGTVGTSTTARLAGLLRNWGAVPAASTKWRLPRLASTALIDRGQPGSVLGLARAGRSIALLLRDRLTRDSWRVIHRPLPSFSPEDPESIAAACDRLVERFAALARLTSDGMSRTPAWRFLDMGICLERGSMVLQSVQGMIPGSASAEDLGALLDLVDGHALFRTRYLTLPVIAPVLDMVLLDPLQPRGLAFQIARLVEHLEALPVLRDDGMMEPPLRAARQLQARLEGLEATAIDPKILGELRASLGELSDAIGSRFFLQEDGPPASDPSTFLA